MKITVSIADDHPMVITGVLRMLEDNADITVLDTYADGASLLDGLQVRQPDVLLLDIQMPHKTGDELAPLLVKKYPEMKIMILTNFDSTLHIQNMLRHGVLGYLLKTTDKETLIKAIETVHGGEEFIQAIMKEKMELAGARARREVTTKSNLTAREREILQCIVDGNSSKEIADKLFLSVRTVENCRFNILLKMDAKNIAVLVKKALAMGLAQ